MDNPFITSLYDNFLILRLSHPRFHICFVAQYHIYTFIHTSYLVSMLQQCTYIASSIKTVPSDNSLHNHTPSLVGM